MQILKTNTNIILYYPSKAKTVNNAAVFKTTLYKNDTFLLEGPFNFTFHK